MSLRVETNQKYKKIPFYRAYKPTEQVVSIKVSIPYKEAGHLDAAINHKLQQYNGKCDNKFYFHRINNVIRHLNTFAGRNQLSGGEFQYDVVVNALVGKIQTNDILYNCRVIKNDNVGLELEYYHDGIQICTITVPQDNIPNGYNATQHVNILVTHAFITPGEKMKAIGRIMFYPKYNYAARMFVDRRRKATTNTYGTEPIEDETVMAHPLESLREDLDAPEEALETYYNLVSPATPEFLEMELIHRIILPDDATPKVLKVSPKNWQVGKIHEADILLYNPVGQAEQSSNPVGAEDSQTDELITSILSANAKSVIIRISNTENKYICMLITILSTYFEVVSIYKPLHENPLSYATYLYGTEGRNRAPRPAAELQREITEINKLYTTNWTVKEETLKQEALNFYNEFYNGIYINMASTYESLAQNLYKTYGAEILTKYDHIVSLYKKQKPMVDAKTYQPLPIYI